MDLRDKVGLLIDDMPEMRSAMRIQLTDAGLEKCDQARSIKEAIDRLKEKRYDLIVCDYNLGQGADGQQLLELVRRKKILPLSTAFMIVTGETGYEQVSTAAEYAPDDYLLKPFTADLLGTRLGRILDKKAALAPIYSQMGEKGDRTKALAACEALLAEGGVMHLTCCASKVSCSPRWDATRKLWLSTKTCCNSAPPLGRGGESAPPVPAR